MTIRWPEGFDFKQRPDDRLESAVEAECDEALQRAGWYVREIQNKRRIKKGFSDRLILRRGRVVFVEYKTKTGRQRPEQIEFMNEIRAHGGEYRIVRGLEDIMDLLGRG